MSDRTLDFRVSAGKPAEIQDRGVETPPVDPSPEPADMPSDEFDPGIERVLAAVRVLASRGRS